MRSADAAPVYQLEILAQAFVLIVLNDDESFGIVADGPAMRIQAIGTTHSIHVAMRPPLKAAGIGSFAIHSPPGEDRSEELTAELLALMRISTAVLYSQKKRRP